MDAKEEKEKELSLDHLLVSNDEEVDVSFYNDEDFNFIPSSDSTYTELVKARDYLSHVKVLLPKFLSQCQTLSRQKQKMNSGALKFSRDDIEIQQARDEIFRSYLKSKKLFEKLMRLCNSCGKELNDVKRLINACWHLDSPQVDQDELSKAVAKFVKLCHLRNRELLSAIKGFKQRYLEGEEEKKTEKHKKSEKEINIHVTLKSVVKILRKIDKCRNHLNRVKATSYIVKYETEDYELSQLLENERNILHKWVEEHQREETVAWKRHGDFMNAILAGLEANLDSVLIEAIIHDINSQFKEDNDNQLAVPRRGASIKTHVKKRQVSRKSENNLNEFQGLSLIGTNKF